VAKAFDSLPYAGLKLHPRAQFWDMADAGHLDILHALFAFADCRAMPALIHTGPDKHDEAGLFRAFFGKYPHVRFILAHARPLEQTLSLMAEHANVYCDTAFVPKTHIRRIAMSGFAERILPGSDFPITHYQAGRHLSLGDHIRKICGTSRQRRSLLTCCGYKMSA
jgi:predicted TIM-barrel fold metal-dependent hydrolase